MEAAIIGPTGRIALGPGVLTIGRMPDNQLEMTDLQSSSHHAEIHPDGQEGYSIVDKGSRNGTYVNGERLIPNAARQLADGDRIRIGETVLTYEVRGAVVIPPTVFAGQPGKGNEPAIQPTVAVPPPIFSGAGYGLNQQNSFQQPPSPAYQPSYTPPPPQYAPPVPPAYNPPVPTRKKSRTGLWITLGIIGLVIVSCIAWFGISYASRSTPTKTLTTFCNDLKNGDYHDAYQQLSSRVQSIESESKFTTTLQKAGGVNDCTFSNVNDNGSTGNAVVTVTVKVTIIPPITKQAKLVNESGRWKIDSVPV